MRVAVISDIHSNLPALEAVLDSIDADAVDEIWCLGDLVGYGADPDACVGLIERRTDYCIAGNHDLAITGELDVSTFSPDAATAARWTTDTIDSKTLTYLNALRPLGEREQVGLFHGSPRDPVWEYVLSLEQADASLALQPQRVALIGHSHVACWFTRNAGGVFGEQAGAGLELDVSSEKWLLNPGSVGQPRDGDPRAAYLVLDSSAGKALFKRVEYPIEIAAQAIIEAGLPDQLADRLYLGQ